MVSAAAAWPAARGGVEALGTLAVYGGGHAAAAAASVPRLLLPPLRLPHSLNSRRCCCHRHSCRRPGEGIQQVADGAGRSPHAAAGRPGSYRGGVSPQPLPPHPAEGPAGGDGPTDATAVCVAAI